MLTSGGLDLQDTLLAGVGLEGVGQGRGDGEDSPLPVGGRAGGRAGWRGGIDDSLVAAPDRGAVGGGVERGHGGRLQPRRGAPGKAGRLARGARKLQV